MRWETEPHLDMHFLFDDDGCLVRTITSVSSAFPSRCVRVYDAQNNPLGIYHSLEKAKAAIKKYYVDSKFEQ